MNALEQAKANGARAEAEEARARAKGTLVKYLRRGGRALSKAQSAEIESIVDDIIAAAVLLLQAEKVAGESEAQASELAAEALRREAEREQKSGGATRSGNRPSGR